jgi:5-methylcytosine-specific restriction endonuclease McrA
MKLSHDRALKDRGWKSPAELPKGPNGYALCRQCQTEVKPPQRTFCSQACIHTWKIRSSPSYAREQVFLRDKGVCAVCKLDTEKLREILYAIRIQSEEHYQQLTVLYRLKYGFGFNLAAHFFEMDHILPVAQGGGSCGLENLQSLCLPCHRDKTREQMRAKRLRRKGRHPGNSRF